MKRIFTLSAAVLCLCGAGAALAAMPPVERPGRTGTGMVAPAEARLTGPGCPVLPVRSPFTGKRVTTFFLNSSGKEPLKLYWIDGVGNWVMKEEIAPGKSTSVSTIIGARWALVDPAGKCVLSPIVNSPSSTFAH